MHRGANVDVVNLALTYPIAPAFLQLLNPTFF